MSFNDIYKMNLKLAVKEIGNQWSILPIISNLLFIIIYPLKILAKITHTFFSKGFLRYINSFLKFKI